MDVNTMLPAIGFIVFLAIDYLMFKLMREKKFKGLIPYLFQLAKKK